MSIKLEERSIYSQIVNFLKKAFNIQAVSEARIDGCRADIVFTIGSENFIMEIKLGDDPVKLSRAISQVYNYAEKLGTRNVIALVFPYLKTNQIILKDYLDKLEDYILSQIVEGYVHTDYWEKWISREDRRSLKSVLEELYRRCTQKDIEIDLNSVIKAIREIVQDLYEVIRQSKTEEIFEEVATKLELFVSIGELKNKDEARRQVNVLASYLLFNQLLFYHIYRIKTNNDKLPNLKPINSLNDLKNYFSKITNIDYQPIYSINIIDKIPDRPETRELINEVIKNLNFIRVEHISHDLAGRFFHALLPKEVAKVWAAFYTHPIAAEILTKLAIERWDETVIDPACGSGTLLAAAYRRKLELYEKEKNKEITEEELRFLHKKFLEEDLTGIDIMPFASHLAAINLALQKIEQPTDVVRISTMDSLTLTPKLISKDFIEKGILIEMFSKKIQKTLNDSIIVLESKRTISPSGIGKEFYIRPVDVVIMNPPFTDRRRLPEDYRKKLTDKTEFGRILGKICGHEVNLWGYFLALADLLLKPRGKIAAVVPISIVKGKKTSKIREYIFSNYHIKYIVKSIKNLAFSESAAFRDILLIAEKKDKVESINENKFVTIILIKKDFKELNEREIDEIVNIAKKAGISHYECKTFEIYRIPEEKFVKDKKYPIRFLWASSFKNVELANNFLEILEKNEKISTIKNKKIKLLRGFETTPKGLVDITFITNPFGEERIEKAKLLLREIKDNKICFEVKGLRKRYEIEKSKILPAIRTAVNVKTLSIKATDYLIIDKPDKFEEIKNLTRWKKDVDWNSVKKNAKKRLTHFAVSYKFNPFSPNTHILSFFSEEKVVPANIFMTFKVSNDEGKIFTLFFNSIIYLLQLLIYKTETTGQHIAITKDDLKDLKIIDISKLNVEEIAILLKLFEEIKNVEFPSIIEQFEKKFWARLKLDKTILQILGLIENDENNIDNFLTNIYNLILQELKEMKQIR